MGVLSIQLAHLSSGPGLPVDSSRGSSGTKGAQPGTNGALSSGNLENGGTGTTSTGAHPLYKQLEENLVTPTRASAADIHPHTPAHHLVERHVEHGVTATHTCTTLLRHVPRSHPHSPTWWCDMSNMEVFPATRNVLRQGMAHSGYSVRLT